MVALDVDVERASGHTFVRAVVHNTHGTDQVVRLESQLDGPTWPPRDGDVPVPEWNGDSWVSYVPAGKKRGVGFASPAEPDDPALVVAETERAPRDEYETIDQVIAELDHWSPPSSVMGDRRAARTGGERP